MNDEDDDDLPEVLLLLGADWIALIIISLMFAK